MRRRTTLALVAGGAAAAAAGGAIVGGRLRNHRPEHDASNPEGRTMEAESWYLENKPKIMRQVRFALRHFRKHLVEAYGKEEGEAIASETMQRFEALLPDLPYIGGDENTLTRNLYLTAAMLAMYRALQARGASVEEAARLIYLGTASFFNSCPDPLAHALAGPTHRSLRSSWTSAGTSPPSASNAATRMTGCSRSSKATGRTSRSVWTTRSAGSSSTSPAKVRRSSLQYLCWIDYPQFAAMHLRLDRTETLAQGGQRCDFRMSRGQPVQVEPEFLHV